MGARDMSEIQVVRSDKEPQSYRYPGIGLRPAIITETAQVGEIHVGSGATGGWHHHGKRTLYGYVVSGKSMIEYGVKGEKHVVLSAGDFFMVPAGLPHRDVNPNKEEAVIMIFNIGPGPASFDLPGP